MLFNSYTFILVFLPIVLVGWWWVFPGERSRLAWLTVASWAFYAYFEFPRGLELLPLLLTSTSVDYLAGRRIAATQHARTRKAWLVLALGVNLGMLGIFKYLGFFEGIVDGLLALAGQPVDVPIHHLVLPIGISFYTFNSMSYTIDVYRGEAAPARSLLHYTAFVALFPHLVAGPIVRYTDIEQQLHALRPRLPSGMAALGVFFFICGLGKKLVLADSLAPTVDRLYANDAAMTVVSGWAAAIGYSLQMYFDFSGYSDMAVGLALLLGLRFPQNFDSPYKARNIADFWRRWHITLSRWMRDYLFIPLGGSKGGTLLTARNLFITMVLAGLWHGAAWTFVLFGVSQGVLLGMHGWARSHGWPEWPVVPARIATYASFVVALVMFRSPTLDTAGNLYAGMFGANGLGLADLSIHVGNGTAVHLGFLLLVAAMLMWVNVAPNTFEFRLRPTRRSAVALGLAFATSFALLAAPSPFLYFQF